MTNLIPGVNQSADEKEAAEFVERIDGLMDEWSDSRGEPRYGWAADTLEGIKDSVVRTGKVTAGQRRAVDNIEESRR